MPIYGPTPDSFGVIRKKLYNSQVVWIEKLKNGNYLFEESCDNYFSCELTKKEVKQLIIELQSLIEEK